MLRGARRFGVGGLAVMVMVLAQACPAGAVVQPGPPPAGPARSGGNTELTLSNIGPGQGVSGFLADPGSGFDPTKGYPASNPSQGFTPRDEGFAGVIHGTPTSGGADLLLYCIDISTNTWIGIGYELGTWDEAGVPHVGFVARILNDFYPNTGEPAELAGNPNARAAAVQAAIWFFSDGYVVSTSDPIHDAVVKIVDEELAKGPVVQPPPPSLTITPQNASGPPGSVVGPFTVTSTAATTVTATDGDMFSDAAATVPIANGATVPSGQQIWLKSTGRIAALLQATATATVPSGNVYLYDRQSGLESAQKLILAQTATAVKTTVEATARFDGNLEIGKQADRRTVPAGGRVGYRITVRNRGRAGARNFRVCDHIPRRMTFLRANRTLRRFGRQRCLVVRRLRAGGRVSFRIVLHVSRRAPHRREGNVADIKPGVRPPARPPAPPADVPGAPGSVADRPLKRARAVVRITAARARRPPPVTG